MDQEDDFNAAFAEAVDAPVDTPAPVEAAVEDPAPVEAVVEDPARVEAEAEDLAVTVDASVPVEAVVETPQPAPAPAALDTKQLAQAIAEANRLAQQPAEPAKVEPEAVKPASYEDYLDENQKKSIEQFTAEWSDVAAPVSALISAHVKAALANQQREILGHVQQQVAPIQQYAAQSQEALYYGTIQAAHPDYREAAAVIPEWIAGQPKIYQARLQEIYQRGSAQEVVDLISMYKQAVGSTGAAPAQPASSAVQAPQKTPVSAAALAATLAPPAAKRSATTTSRDPNDADSAFQEAFGATA
ncbi:hypothetical protein [Pseudomonas phage Rollin]|nr:hypothetical protein [Pseudomonas phage Rollin]